MALIDVLTPALLLLAAATSPAPGPQTLSLWPGYTVALPAGYCVELSRGPDFDVISLHDQSAPKSPILLGLYAGHNPEDLECKNATARQWRANGLSFKSARSADGCAEFLVEDPQTPQRGYLHLWFGPSAKDHAQTAEGVVASIRPAPLPIYRPDDLPTCK